MSNEDMLSKYSDMMESIDPDSAVSLNQLRNDPTNKINNATIASWTKSVVGHVIQSGKSATVSPLKLMHDKALEKTEFDDVSNEISSLYDCALEFKKAEMNIEDIANISKERIKDDSLKKMESNLDSVYSSIETAIIRSFGMLSSPVKYLKNYLKNDVKPKLKDMIKKFSSKLKEEFINMLNKIVKLFFQIFNEFVSKVFSFIEMINGIAKSKGFGLKSVTVSFEPPGFGQIDIFGFSLPIPKVSLPKVEINFEMRSENKITN
jgi:hypothetical protein